MKIKVMSVSDALDYDFKCVPTVYMYMCKQQKLYTGITHDMGKRIYQHFRYSEWFDTAQWVVVFQDDKWATYDLLTMERLLITFSRRFVDMYNIQHNRMPMSVKALLIKRAVQFFMANFVTTLWLIAAVALTAVAVRYGSTIAQRTKKLFQRKPLEPKRVFEVDSAGIIVISIIPQERKFFTVKRSSRTEKGK